MFHPGRFELFHFGRSCDQDLKGALVAALLGAATDTAGAMACFVWRTTGAALGAGPDRVTTVLEWSVAAGGGADCADNGRADIGRNPAGAVEPDDTAAAGVALLGADEVSCGLGADGLRGEITGPLDANDDPVTPTAVAARPDAAKSLASCAARPDGLCGDVTGPRFALLPAAPAAPDWPPADAFARRAFPAGLCGDVTGPRLTPPPGPPDEPAWPLAPDAPCITAAEPLALAAAVLGETGPPFDADAPAWPAVADTDS
jgi:hypothetical protein